MTSHSGRKTVSIRTLLPKLPFPTNATRQPIRTERLLIRPLQSEDVHALHELRSIVEVMRWTLRGLPDPDLDFTRNNLQRFLPPNDTRCYNWAICLGETGEFIGIGGSHLFDGDLGWPELGYMLHPSSWGKGYASEFLQGFLQAWWLLPRQPAELEVDIDTVTGDDELKEEVLTAVTDAPNLASQRVLIKSGFQLVKIYVEEDEEAAEKAGEREEMKKLPQEVKTGVIHGFVIARPIGQAATEHPVV